VLQTDHPSDKPHPIYASATRAETVVEVTGYLLCVVAVSVCGIVLALSVVYSDSTDLGGHYATADYIAKSGAWPPPESSAYPADNYPLLSYTLAALLGLGLGSTLRGLLVVAMLSACSIYAVLGWAGRRSDTFGVPFVLLAGCLMLLLAPLNIFWGNEIIYNFFYSQIVGNAFFVLVLFQASIFHSLRAKLLLVCVSTVLLGQIYTISSLDLALSAPLLWIIPILRTWYATKIFQFRRFRDCVILAGFLLFLVVATPTFFGMITIASHNGGISVRLGNWGILLLILAAVGLWIALAIFSFLNRTGLKNADFVLAALGGVTGAAMLQWISWNVFGHGSDYAVSKHAFGLGTMVVIGLATVAADVVAILNDRTRFLSRNWRWLQLPAFVGPSLFMILAFISLWALHRPTFKVSDLETYEADARRLVSTDPFNKTVYGHAISFNSEVTDGINYIVAKAALGLRDYNQVEQVFILAAPLTPEQQTARYFLISVTQAKSIQPSCLVDTRSVLTVSRLARASCYDEIMANKYKKN
jgi:hypothetical protein